jgi:predicted metal-dependent peptidase
MRPSKETLSDFRDRLTKARSKLLSREPFLGFLALELPTQIAQSSNHEVDTAATDGRSYFYNYLWCRQLTDAELLFVVAHEVAHVMFLHTRRRGERDSHLWNAACDFAINGLLVASATGDGSLAGVAAMPSELNSATGRLKRIGLWDASFANLSAELIYDELVKIGADVARNWDLLLECEATGTLTQVRAAVAKALIRTKEYRNRCGRGDKPGQWERWAEEGLRGTVRWQDRFRERILASGTDVPSWSRPNRKYLPHGIYLPRYRGYELPNLLVAFDSSGSVTDRFLGRMVAELNQMLLGARNSIVRLISCDAAVHLIGDFNTARRLDPKMKSLCGGGGTDFRPVFDYAANNKCFRNLVYMTDGQGIFPDTPPPGLRTLWLIPEDASVSVPFGEIIPLPLNP